MEVLKGPAGTDTGRSVPTGAINVVSKEAKLGTFYNGSIMGSTADQKRVTADVNYQLSDTSALRLNILDQDSGRPGRDIVKDRRWGIAPSLAFGLGTDTRVVIDYLYMKQNNIPDSGVPTLDYYYNSIGQTPSRRINPSNYYGTVNDFDNGTVNKATLKIEHDFSNDLTLRNTSRWARTEEQAVYTTYSSPIVTDADPNNWYIRRNESGAPTTKFQTNEILTNQTNLSAKFFTGPFKHSLNAGLEFTREEQTNYGATVTSYPDQANLYNPNADVSGYSYYMNGNNTYGKTDTVAGYLFDTMTLTEHWQLDGGVRWDHYNTTFNSVYPLGTACNATGSKGAIQCPPGVAPGTIYNIDANTAGTLFSWKLGVVYKPVPNGSFYANYAVSAQPPGGDNFALSYTSSSADNPALEPQKANTVEVGTKWEVFDRRLMLTAALYRTEVLNDVEIDADSPTGYSQYGKKTVQGVELGATGNITPEWKLSTGFAVTDTKIVQGATESLASSGLPFTSKYAFTLWSTYKLPFGLTVGGGARYRSKLSGGSTTTALTPLSLPGYWVFDAMASYPVSDKADLRLNVYNVFDKQYAVSISKNGTRYTPGAPLYATLSLNFHF